MERPRTKLVCTIGPASVGRVRELVDLGMSVARINFSHGTPEEQRQAVHAVRAAAHHARRSVAVLIDLPGLKIRLGDLPGGELELETGAPFELRVPAQPGAGGANDGPAAAEADESGGGASAGVVVNHPGLIDQLQVGDRVLIADGAAELAVSAIDGTVISTEVVRGGLIRSRAGVSVPSERLTGPSLTPSDEEGLARAIELRCDMVGQSFVRTAADLRDLRRRLPPDGPLVVAKIETRAAVDDFDAIAQVADGVMIARGDLGVDLPFAEVPLVQKELIRRARRHRRFTIVATQMLESMTSAPRPTRAEASDVANAVLDGADALMLSGETAIGQYPVAAARAMLDIVSATEQASDNALRGAPARVPNGVAGGALSALPAGAEAQQSVLEGAASMLAGNELIDAAWCFTRAGRTAQRLADYQPRQPILAFTVSPIVARRLAVRHGVLPIVLSGARAGEPLIDQMATAARGHGALGPSALILLVTTSTAPDGINRLELHRLDEA